ncbi:hypothetical protein DNH61_03375 [Paenibacillus sambharensis]|uniref:Uncharacterized protein n=1 Tax=Paenibacillus sambharensis TaxID=1803190 RepID=A0A2W1M0D9_9BACL|nr:hypothetical protein [Paenibacillus sambharensis]PZD97401.1 hypothetical protein DNH61_03375 [Paenibacillus sambharensis]
MSRVRKGYVLRYADGCFFIEEAPYKVSQLGDAEVYFKYFDLLEAQERVKRQTGESAEIAAVTFTIANTTFV